jgi:hypothetical protein
MRLDEIRPSTPSRAIHCPADVTALSRGYKVKEFDGARCAKIATFVPEAVLQASLGEAAGFARSGFRRFASITSRKQKGPRIQLAAKAPMPGTTPLSRSIIL